MTDVTVTAANVKRSDANSATFTGKNAAAATAGQVMYLNSSGKLALAQCDGTAAEAAAVGIAVTSAPGTDQDLVVITKGLLTMSGLTKGTVYAVSATAGGIAPVADLVSGNYVTVLGVAISSTQLLVDPIISGITV